MFKYSCLTQDRGGDPCVALEHNILLKTCRKWKKAPQRIWSRAQGCSSLALTGEKKRALRIPELAINGPKWIWESLGSRKMQLSATPTCENVHHITPHELKRMFSFHESWVTMVWCPPCKTNLSFLKVTIFYYTASAMHQLE